MKINRITSHVLGYDLPERLGCSQQFYDRHDLQGVIGLDIAQPKVCALVAMPPLPGRLRLWEPWLEFDATDNEFRDDLLAEPLNIEGQVKATGRARIPTALGLGGSPDRAVLDQYRIA